MAPITTIRTFVLLVAFSCCFQVLQSTQHAGSKITRSSNRLHLTSQITGGIFDDATKSTTLYKVHGLFEWTATSHPLDAVKTAIIKPFTQVKYDAVTTHKLKDYTNNRKRSSNILRIRVKKQQKRRDNRSSYKIRFDPKASDLKLKRLTQTRSGSNRILGVMMQNQKSNNDNIFYPNKKNMIIFNGKINSLETFGGRLRNQIKRKSYDESLLSVSPTSKRISLYPSLLSTSFQPLGYHSTSSPRAPSLLQTSPLPEYEYLLKSTPVVSPRLPNPPSSILVKHQQYQPLPRPKYFTTTESHSTISIEKHHQDSHLRNKSFMPTTSSYLPSLRTGNSVKLKNRFVRDYTPNLKPHSVDTIEDSPVFMIMTPLVKATTRRLHLLRRGMVRTRKRPPNRTLRKYNDKTLINITTIETFGFEKSLDMVNVSISDKHRPIVADTALTVSQQRDIHAIHKRNIPPTDKHRRPQDNTDATSVPTVYANESSMLNLYIGGLFELTGNKYGGNGHSELLATQMAIRHVNHLEVIPGYRLELLFNDSQCDPGVGTDAFYDLVYRKSKDASLMMLMGGACNEVTKTLAEIVNYWNIVMISYAADSPALSDREKYRTFFRMGLGHSALNPPRRMLLEHFGWTKVAVLYEDIDALSLAFNTIGKDFAAHGITVTLAESFKNAVVESPTKLRKLKEQDVRIIVAGFSEAVARTVLCEAYMLGLTGSRYVWILVGGLRRHWWSAGKQFPDTSCTVAELSQAVDGMFTVLGLDGMLHGETSIGNLSYSDFLNEYNLLNRSDPVTMYSAISYDTVWTMALAIRDALHRWERNGTALQLHQLNYSQMEHVQDDLIESVERLTFSGVSGPVSFVGSDREGVSVVYQLQDGNYTPVALHKPFSSHLDFGCDLCRPVVWTAGKVPKDAQTIVLRMKAILPSVFYPALALCLCGILMAVFFLAYNLYYRRLKFIKLSSPNLNNVAVLGCIMAYCDVVLLGLDDKILTNHAYSIVCTARAFLLSSGFSLAFGAMFAKTFRVHRIFTRANRGLVKSRLIRDSHLLVIIGVLLILDIALVSAWVVVDPMTRHVYNLTQKVSDDDPDLVYQDQLTTCYSDHLQEWLGAFYAYKGLLLIFGLYMAWETRHVKIPALNDSQYIGLNVYNVVIMAVCVVVISNIVSTRPNLAYAMVASFMILSTTVTLCLLFVPKICAIVASGGNPIVASSGILVDRSNTRRFVFDDRKEVLYRAEVQNRVYKREIMELDQKISRLERLLDIPLHPIPRLTEELLYLLPQTLGERAMPIGFRRGRRKALEWCNSISDGGEGVTWSATDSEDLMTDVTMLPAGRPSVTSHKPKDFQHRRKVALNQKPDNIHQKINLSKESCRESSIGSKQPMESGKSSVVFKRQRKEARKHKTDIKSGYKASVNCPQGSNNKNDGLNTNQRGSKNTSYNMLHQSLDLLKLSLPAVPFAERIDLARSLPEIFDREDESSRKESVDDIKNNNDEDSSHQPSTPLSFVKLIPSQKKTDNSKNDQRLSLNRLKKNSVDESNDSSLNNGIQCQSQLSPSHSWPPLDFRDETVLWEKSKSHRLFHKKGNVLEYAKIFRVSDFQVVSIDDNSGDENGNDLAECCSDGSDDDEEEEKEEEEEDGDSGSESDVDEWSHEHNSLVSNENHDHLKYFERKRLRLLHHCFDNYISLAVHHPFHYHKFSKHRKYSYPIQFQRQKQLYLPLDQSEYEHTKSGSCPRFALNHNVSNDDLSIAQPISEDNITHKTLHNSEDDLIHRSPHISLRHLFKPRSRHHHQNNSSTEIHHRFHHPYYRLHHSNHPLEHHNSNPTVPDLHSDLHPPNVEMCQPPLEEESTPSPLFTLTTWQSCSAIEPSVHSDNRIKEVDSIRSPRPLPFSSSPHLSPNEFNPNHKDTREITKTNNSNKDITQVTYRCDNGDTYNTLVSSPSLPFIESLTPTPSQFFISSLHENSLPLTNTKFDKQQQQHDNIINSPIASHKALVQSEAENHELLTMQQACASTQSSSPLPPPLLTPQQQQQSASYPNTNSESNQVSMSSLCNFDNGTKINSKLWPVSFTRNSQNSDVNSMLSEFPENVSKF